MTTKRIKLRGTIPGIDLLPIVEDYGAALFATLGKYYAVTAETNLSAEHHYVWDIGPQVCLVYISSPAEITGYYIAIGDAASIADLLDRRYGV